MNIPSNMTNDEAFRLYGTLPPERIQQMLDAETDAPALANRIKEHLQAARDGLPCEDFAEDIIWRLESILVDHETTKTMREDIEQALDALKQLQADLFKRAEAAAKHLRGIEDELSAWVRA
jgi:hypothetical protein